MVVRLGLTAIVPLVIEPALAQWQPAEEPADWQAVRKQHLPGEGWTFMEAVASPDLQAAEYIRNRRPVQGAVELEAGLLLKRSGQQSWTSRVLAMRADCSAGHLDRRGPDGQWTRYPGRADTAVKVRWICTQQ